MKLQKIVLFTVLIALLTVQTVSASEIGLVKPPDEVLIVPPEPTQPINPLMYLVPMLLGTGLVVKYGKGIPNKSKAIKSSLLMLSLVILTFLSVPTPVVNAYAFGNPLTTASIGLFAYYNETADWTLADTVSGWQSYTDNGNYYDGIVRVWQDVNGATYVGNDVYIDVNIRVRADGWIMAWLNQSQSKADIVHWGRERQSGSSSAPSPQTGTTSLYRAMQRLYVAASVSPPANSAVNYYDYEYTSATKLIMFGNVATTSGSNYDDVTETAYYALLPSTVEYAIVGYGGFQNANDGGASTYRLSIDGSTIFTVQTGVESGWSTYVVESAYKTIGIKHTYVLFLDNGWGSVQYYVNVAITFVFWLS